MDTFFGAHIIFTVSSIIMFIAFSIVIFVFIYRFVKNSKNNINSVNTDTFKNLNNALKDIMNSQNVTEDNDKDGQKVEYVCDYCGATLGKDEKYCFACGSKKRTKKQSSD